MATNFKPIGDRVLVLPSQVKEKTDSGILIPETAKDKPLEGVIVETGSVEKLKVDMNVLYGQYSGSEITLEGTKYLILREADIIGII
jgi:chaperonin GroES